MDEEESEVQDEPQARTRWVCGRLGGVLPSVRRAGAGGGLGRLGAGSSGWSRSPSYFSVVLLRLTCPVCGLSAFLSPQSHVGEALPPEMVTRLFEGMRRADPTGKATGPSARVSQEQFTLSMSHLLRGSSEEKSLVILAMAAATDGPAEAREVLRVRGHRGPHAAPRGLGGLGWGTQGDEAAEGGSGERCTLGGSRPRPQLRSGLLDKKALAG